MEMILTIQDKYFFEKIIRSSKEFQQFIIDYRENEINLFDCQIYSQNFSYLINELDKKINDETFMIRHIDRQKELHEFREYYIQAWKLIEKIRIQKSKVKIFINEFIFSEN